MPRYTAKMRKRDEQILARKRAAREALEARDYAPEPSHKPQLWTTAVYTCPQHGDVTATDPGPADEVGCRCRYRYFGGSLGLALRCCPHPVTAVRVLESWYR